MDQPYLGVIVMFAGGRVPRGWALCDGSLLNISQNSVLFAILGTTYGGNGTTTFALPDLRGRTPIQQGQGPGLSMRKLGESGGTEQVTLTINQMPAHNHDVKVPVSEGRPTSETPNGNILTSQGENFYVAPGTADGIYGGVTDSIVGGNQPTGTMSPFLAINFIIALEGIFPPPPYD